MVELLDTVTVPSGVGVSPICLRGLNEAPLGEVDLTSWLVIVSLSLAVEILVKLPTSQIKLAKRVKVKPITNFCNMSQVLVVNYSRP